MRKQLNNRWEQLAFVMKEVFCGHKCGATFLDDEDIALLGMLAQLTEGEASGMVCGSSVISHARHVLYSITAYSNAIRQNAPSFIADGWPEWDASKAKPGEWSVIVSELSSKVAELLALLNAQSGRAEQPYLCALGALAHMSFHLGAIQVKYDVLKTPS